MEYMDYTLDGYIAAHNSTLTIVQRKWNLLQEITVIWPDLYAITIMTIITI